MFIFDVDQPQVVYTAEDFGTGFISRIDLRTNVGEAIFSTDYCRPYCMGNTNSNLNSNLNSSDGTGTKSGIRPFSDNMCSVKALAQSDVLGGSQLLIGGSKSFTLGLLDLRILSPIPHNWDGEDIKNRYKGSPFVKMWSPSYPSITKAKKINENINKNINKNNLNSNKNLDKYLNDERKHNISNVSTSSSYGVSLSGLCFSSDGASILASYQGDQIYIFDTFSNMNNINNDGNTNGYRCPMGTEQLPHTENFDTNFNTNFNTNCNKNENGNNDLNGFEKDEVRENIHEKNQNIKSNARNLLGGHINHATFLKSVSFFGPKDEYVVSGSDSGHLWIWDSSSGSLDIDEPEDRTCRVINFLKAGIFYFNFILF